jgi:hypothetical protein
MAKIDPEEACPCGSGEVFKNCHGPLVRSREPVIARHVALQLIPKPMPGTATVFEHVGDGTRLFIGTETDVSYDCGECGSSLIAGAPIERFVSIVIKCGKCESFNLTAVARASRGRTSPRKLSRRKGTGRRRKGEPSP